jgi:glycine C-acetyltransferase
MFSHLKDQFADELKAIRASGMYKEEGILESEQGAEITVNGRKLLNFCANNYLGLAGSAQLRELAKEAIDKYGFGMASVRFICGTSTVHKELEGEIAKFLGFEDAILYSSCFDANTGLFETILAEGDAVFSDELNHASIIDGIRLCKAERFRFKHADMQDLEEKLKEAGGHRRKLIVTDGVFSMDGDTAKLKEICDLADTYQALVMVDDSHASGVLGKTGRGSIEQQGVMGRVDILTSTFGKALGGAGGGFTAARREIVEYLRQRSRPYLFSNTLIPAVAHTALHVLKNFDTEDFTALRQMLIANTKHFRDQMQKLGFTLGGDGSHPITPVMLFDEKLAVDMANALLERGIYVRGFTYPVVPKGKARIRVQLSASHTREHLDKAVEAFRQVASDFKIVR